MGKGYEMTRAKEEFEGEEREGLRFTGPTGAPVAPIEYFAAKNQGDMSAALGDLTATLHSSHAGDKNLARLIDQEIKTNGGISQDFENTYWWLFRR
jgi:hypothetical protein